MRVINSKDPKVCFAKPGDVIQLPDDEGVARNPLYLVCTIPVKTAELLKMKVQQYRASNGLYSDERPFWLVDLETGESRPMPHLSSRCRIVRDATVVYGQEPT